MAIDPGAPNGAVPPDFAAALAADAYERFGPTLVRRLTRLTRDAEASSDIAQEAFARLLGQARQDRVPREVDAWLWRVSTNLVASEGRHEAAGRRWQTRQGEAGPAPSPEEALLRGELRAELDDALLPLTPDARMTLLLASEGFRSQEIARAIRRTDGATRTLLCRARGRARARLRAAEGPARQTARHREAVP
ncbi:MAG TPA: sigma-70 family RNA polymerase sigma factor [Candidatus Limnocylindrales bacterium]